MEEDTSNQQLLQTEDRHLPLSLLPACVNELSHLAFHPLSILATDIIPLTHNWEKSAQASR